MEGSGGGRRGPQPSSSVVDAVDLAGGNMAVAKRALVQALPAMGDVASVTATPQMLRGVMNAPVVAAHNERGAAHDMARRRSTALLQAATQGGAAAADLVHALVQLIPATDDSAVLAAVLRSSCTPAAPHGVADAPQDAAAGSPPTSVAEGPPPATAAVTETPGQPPALLTQPHDGCVIRTEPAGSPQRVTCAARASRAVPALAGGSDSPAAVDSKDRATPSPGGLSVRAEHGGGGSSGSADRQQMRNASPHRLSRLCQSSDSILNGSPGLPAAAAAPPACLAVSSAAAAPPPAHPAASLVAAGTCDNAILTAVVRRARARKQRSPKPTFGARHRPPSKCRSPTTEHAALSGGDDGTAGGLGSGPAVARDARTANSTMTGLRTAAMSAAAAPTQLPAVEADGGETLPQPGRDCTATSTLPWPHRPCYRVPSSRTQPATVKEEAVEVPQGPGGGAEASAQAGASLRCGGRVIGAVRVTLACSLTGSCVQHVWCICCRRTSAPRKAAWLLDQVQHWMSVARCRHKSPVALGSHNRERPRLL